MTFVGTPSYMSPEALFYEGEIGTIEKYFQFDIWSAGIILYELFYGH